MNKGLKMKVETKKVRLSEIKPNPDNPRQISKTQIDRLVKSITEFPEMMELREIVVDETMTILGGNMRFRALKEAGEKEAIAKIATGLTPEQKREFIVKDNAVFGEWDMDALANAWGDLPLVDWGVPLSEDWMAPIETLESIGKLSGGNYGDISGDKIPINLLGIGGMLDRDLMMRVRQKLLDNGGDLEGENGEILTALFLGYLT